VISGSHFIGIAATALERLGGWIVRNQEEDVSIDMEAVLSDPDPSGHIVSRDRARTGDSVKPFKSP
jgi:hypothetical protein